jgi:DNA-binding winged helix-turn-helix (wHTH) protein
LHVDYYFTNAHPNQLQANQFQFNGLSLVLLKDGKPLAIRNNEAKLLAFFLANPQQVFSKEAILENVWAGKVVSEQAVFQAISNLRTLFGDEAIKTFPKKGYQWQIDLQPAPPVISPTQGPIPAEQTTSTTNSITSVNKHRHQWLPWLSATLVVAALYFTLLIKPTAVTNTDPIPIIVQPFVLDANNTGAPDIAQQVQDAVVEHINNQASLVVHVPPSNHSPHQVAAAPAHFLTVYNQSIAANLLVSGRVRQAGDQLILSFVVQGQQNQWKGYVTATNSAGLAAEVNALLSKIAPMKVLWESKDLRLINAQLQLLYSENPGNLAMLYQLVDNSLYLGDVDKARLHAQELEQQAHSAMNLPYQALALRAQALASLDLIDTAQYIHLLDKSVALATEFNDPILQSRVMEYYTYIYHQLKNFESMERNLLDALALAETAQAPEQQAQVLRLLAIFSYKLNRPDKRDEYLARAQHILDQYQFPSESYALLEDIAGMFSDEKTQKEHFFWQALNRFTPEQEAWVKERAQEHLVNLYIDQQRWHDAHAVFAKETNLSGAELFYQAEIHFKENNFSLAKTQAEAAFKQANISGEYSASLEAALLLAQLHQQFTQPALQKTYLEYINKNALPSWKKSKEKALAELSDDLKR